MKHTQKNYALKFTGKNKTVKKKYEHLAITNFRKMLEMNPLEMQYMNTMI